MNPSFLKQAERRLGRYAIPNLTTYLVLGQSLALILGLAAPAFLGALALVPAEVMSGQWWRLLSFVFTPPGTNLFFAFFALYMLYFMGGSLEAQWGAFRFNLYVLISLLMTIAAAFVFPFSVATNTYITGSIFLAFAYLYPDFQIFLFMILPVRIKWIALATWLFYGYDFVTGDWATRLLIAAAVTNFFVFFGADLFYKARYGQRKMRRQSLAIVNRDKPLHVCTICGVSDKSDRTMEFRYCTKCEPPVAYCSAHLRNHEHRPPLAAG